MSTAHIKNGINFLGLYANITDIDNDISPIKLIAAGTLVTLLDTTSNDTWAKIKHTSTEGWVQKKFLDAYPSSSSEDTSEWYIRFGAYGDLPYPELIVRWKGNVATTDVLNNKTNMSIGDMYNVVSSNTNYVWTGETWDPMFADVQQYEFATNMDIENMFTDLN